MSDFMSYVIDFASKLIAGSLVIILMVSFLYEYFYGSFENKRENLLKQLEALDREYNKL